MKCFGKPGLYSWVGLIGLLAVNLSAQNLEEPAPQVTSEVQSAAEPSEPDYISDGDVAFEESDYEAAIAAYQNIHPTELPPDAQNRMGLAHHMLNRGEEAEAYYRIATVRDKKLSAGLNNLGAIHYAEGDFKNAENRFKDALKFNTENRVFQENLRAAKYARENSRRARETIEGLRDENPFVIHSRQGDTLRVTLLMEPAVLQEVRNLEIRGDTFLVRKLYEDAIIEYQRSIDLDRYNPFLRNKLGIAYHQSEHLRDAERQYREALKLNPYYFEALNNLGSIEFARRRYDRALDYYRQALETRPDAPTVLQNIGSCLFAMERFEDGLLVFIHALRLNPNLFRDGDGLGTVVRTAQSNGSRANFYMAKLFAQFGNKDQTMSFLYRAVEEGFDDEGLLEDPVFDLLVEDERFVQLIVSIS